MARRGYTLATLNWVEPMAILSGRRPPRTFATLMQRTIPGRLKCPAKRPVVFDVQDLWRYPGEPRFKSPSNNLRTLNFCRSARAPEQLADCPTITYFPCKVSM